MNMNERFQDNVHALIEQRVIEASKKQVPQKLLSVAKWLGRPIIAQTLFGDRLDDTWKYDDDMIYDPNSIPTMKFSEDRTYEGGEWGSLDRGYNFDGLKCGINLCITALLYDNKLDELKATYNGYLVFAEIEGALKAYAPFPAWENALDMFYEAAVQREREQTIKEKAKRQEVNRQKMKNFWQKFRMLWGY